MTDFLVGPNAGKTPFKIDPSIQNNTTLWPSSKMAPLSTTDGVMTGTGTGQLATGQWNLVYKGVTSGQTPAAPSDGLYHFNVTHLYASPYGQPVPFSYSINTGAQKALGSTYYSQYQDMGVFLSLKKGDVIKLWEPAVYYNLTMYPTYSRIYHWSLRRLVNRGGMDEISAF
jgi:hypothetical protein